MFLKQALESETHTDGREQLIKLSVHVPDSRDKRAAHVDKTVWMRKNGARMKKSPKILSSGWGKIVIENLSEFKDVKLLPGGGKAWDWREHGTGHSEGVQPAELNDLIAAGCRHVVLAKGRLKRLHTPEITLKKLEQLGIKTYVLDTNKAIARYNKLVERGEPAGGLFHTTC